MRRRADGWLNATQILKVAGFDKPQRTRVLEREVQKGLHEKVQGGYGKYQGEPIARKPAFHFCTHKIRHPSRLPPLLFQEHGSHRSLH